MDSYPDLQTLVAGMQPTFAGSLGSTNGWDVVVSYSVDQLNTLLGSLWKASSPIPTSGISFTTNEYDPRSGTQYTEQWWVTLGTPTLSFEIGGGATLTMNLDASFQATGTNPVTGGPYPVNSLPTNTYQFIATVPLAAVSAKTVNGATTTTPVGDASNIISFDSDPSSSLHIVFDFATTGSVGANYSIVPTTGEFTQITAEIATWLGQPANMGGIAYSLAVVTQTVVPNIQYLTPKQIAFSSFAPTAATATANGVGCLCVYIQTNESGFPPGQAANRSFNLLSDGTATYPIPTGFSASIIISHTVFGKYFLQQSLNAAVNGSGQKLFNSVVINDSNQGFSVTAEINSTAIANFSDKGIWGIGLQVTQLNWDFGDAQFNLSIANGQSTWSYSFTNSLSWSIPNMYGTNEWGNTDYTASLNQVKSTFTEGASDSQNLEMVLSVATGDWSYNIQPEKLSGWDMSNGGQETIPIGVRNGLATVTLPALSSTMDLDYFATTNVFAPGQQIINVASSLNVYTPYDILIVGNVAAAPQPSSQRKLVHLPNHLPPSLGARPGTARGNADYMLDMLAGKPIYGQTLTALTSGDQTTVDNFLASSGYDIDVTALQKTMQDTASGPDFDIRQVAGLYSFSEPSDLAAIKMTVDPSTGRLYFDNLYVSNTTTDGGEVTWTYNSAVYSITFKMSYEDDGDVNPTTFSGTRSMDGQSPVNVSGKQIKKPPPEYWADTNVGVTAAWIAGIFGAGFSVMVWALDKYKQRKAAQEKVISDQLREAADTAKKSIKDAAKVGQLDINVSDFQRDVEAQIQQAIETTLNGNENASPEELQQAASDAGTATLTERYTEAYRPLVLPRISGFGNLLGLPAVNAAVNFEAQSRIAGRLSQMTPASPYIIEIAGAENSRFKAQAAANSERAASAQVGFFQQEVNAAQQQQKDINTKKELLIEADEKAKKTRQQIDADVAPLDKLIEDEQEREREAQAGQADASEKANASKKTKEENEKKEQEQRERAQDSSHRVFGGE